MLISQKTFLLPGPLSYYEFNRFIPLDNQLQFALIGLVDQYMKSPYSNRIWTEACLANSIYIDEIHTDYIASSKSCSDEAFQLYCSLFNNCETLLLYDRSFPGNLLSNNAQRFCDLLQRCIYCVSILKKHQISNIIFIVYPHNIHFWVLYKAALFLRLRTIIIDNRFHNMIVISDSSSNFTLNKATIPPTVIDSVIPIGPSGEAIYSAKSVLRKQISSFNSTATLFRNLIDINIKHLAHDLLSNYLKTRYLKSLKKLSVVLPINPTKRKKIVYFLHYQTESIMLPMAGVFCNQLLAIYQLWSCLPPDCDLYIKEHPSTRIFDFSLVYNDRTIEYLNFINNLENCFLLSHDTTTDEIFKCVDAVATIQGSVVGEAIDKGVKVITFYKFQENSDTRKLIFDALKLPQNSKLLADFLCQNIAVNHDTKISILNAFYGKFIYEDGLNYNFARNNIIKSAWIKALEVAIHDLV